MGFASLCSPQNLFEPSTYLDTHNPGPDLQVASLGNNYNYYKVGEKWDPKREQSNPVCKISHNKKAWSNARASQSHWTRFLVVTDLPKKGFSMI